MSTRVLHVTESMGAGTATAIGQYVASGDCSHQVLARVRDDSFVAEPWLESVPHVLVPSVSGLLGAWLRARKQPLDVVHAHSTVAGQLVRLFPHPTARTVYSPHGLAAVHHRRRSVRTTLSVSERALSRRTAAVAAVGASEEAELAMLVDRTPIIRLPHAVPARSGARELPDSPHLVCAIGRLTYQKAPETVTDFPRRLAERGIDARWVWVGDGDHEMRSTMERGGWTVTGWVSGAEVTRQVSDATVLLHPARYEGLSLAIVESLSHGTPVVARNITANTEFGGVRLFDSTDEAAELVERLATDREEWSVLSKAALEYVEREHGVSAQADALATLYGEVRG